MDTSVEWFDAIDGPEEFIIPPEPKDTEDLVVETVDDSDSEGEATGDVLDSEFTTSAVEQKKVDVQRRTNLPAPTIENEMSLLSVLKKNIGKVRGEPPDILNPLIVAAGPRYHLATSFLQRTDLNSPTARRRSRILFPTRSSYGGKRSSRACLAHCRICNIWVCMHSHSRGTKAFQPNAGRDF